MNSSHESVSIPINPDITLEGIIYRPSGPPRLVKGYAVIAHPYAPLGGNMHDPVIRTLTKSLLTSSIPTLTYNARGVGSSTGSVSYLGGGDAGEDFGRVVEWLVGWEAAERGEGRDSGSGRGKRVDVYACGYSFGSLPASIYSPTPSFPHLLNVHHILISPPTFLLAPSWVTTPVFSWLFSGYAGKTRRILEGEGERERKLEASGDGERTDPGTKQWQKRILLIYGDQDQFSASSRFTAYIQKITPNPQATSSETANESPEVDRRLIVKKIVGADHFWREGGMMEELRRGLEEWLES